MTVGLSADGLFGTSMNIVVVVVSGVQAFVYALPSSTLPVVVSWYPVTQLAENAATPVGKQYIEAAVVSILTLDDMEGSM
jgi:hypothetical protein